MTARAAAKRTGPAHATPPAGLTGDSLVLAGVAVAALATPVAMLPGGYNPFGPAKLLVLLAGVTLVALGFALRPATLLSATRALARSRGSWAALAVVALALLATATSIAPEQSLVGHYPEYQGTVLLLAASLAGLGAFSLGRRDDAWRVLGACATATLLASAAYAVVQYAGLDPVPYARELLVRRVQSTSGNASNLGVLLVLALPLALAFARTTGSRVWRVLAWAAVALGALTLAWSLSRGAWLGAVVGALVWLLAESRRWSRPVRLRAAAVVAGVALAVLLALALLVPNAASRLGSALDTQNGTVGWRVEVWGATTQLVAARPLLGFGPATYRYAFPPRRTAAMQVGETGTQVLDDPHNLFASAAVAAGVPAAAALAWLFAEALIASFALRSDDAWPLAGAALGASVAGALVSLQFHFATLDSAPLLAVAIGLALGRHALRGARPDEAATARSALGLRVAAGAAAALLALGAVAAGGLVLADRQIARGYALLGEGAAWTQVRAPFRAAETLAPWEPAATWALGRAGTQWMGAHSDASAGADAIAALDSAAPRLPADPLLAAQRAEAYLVQGLLARDRAGLTRALELAREAIALDPQNGFRYTPEGSALLALGDSAAARQAFETAVRYSPNDAQAWSDLARLYGQTGEAHKAAAAAARAAALQSGSPAPSP